MKNKLTIAILSAMTVAGVQQLNAKTFVPYHPEKAELGTTINPSDYYTFTPTSSYSLDVFATADATIKVADVRFNGFLYTTSAAGTDSFVVKGSNIDIYCNGSYVGKTTVGKLEESTKIDFPKDVFGERVLAEGADEEFPEYIWSVVDSQDAQTGIYSPLNILKNPGFEEVESYLNEDESRYIPTFWTADDAAGFNTGNSRANVLELADWGGNLENAIYIEQFTNRIAEQGQSSPCCLV